MTFAFCCCLIATAVAAQPPEPSAENQNYAAAGESAATPIWIDPPDSVNAGYYSLRWDADAAGDPKLRFEVQEDTSAEFMTPRLIYSGPETGTTLSGKANGTYFYRVRVANTVSSERGWSATHAVVVAHHPLNRAFAFLILGAVVFLATAVLILRGNAIEDRTGDDAKSGAAN